MWRVLEPEVAGLLKRETTSKGKKHRKGEREKKIKREVGINIYRTSTKNQAYYLLAQYLHAKSFQFDACPPFT